MPFSVEQLIFYTFATVLVGAVLGVIASRNPVHAALFLVLSFFSSAALWILLEAEFLGLVLIFVYVGAVMVLFLFVVMMLDINLAVLREGYTRYAPVGFLVAIIMAVEIGYVVWAKRLGLDFINSPSPHSAAYSNTRELGKVLYTEYVYPFEIASVILLLGIIAAIMLTLRRREGTRHQDPARQVRVNRNDRVRLIKMPAEKDE